MPEVPPEDTRGASGSWQITAKPRVPSGGLRHSKAGETSSPSPVNFAGIAPWDWKAGLLSAMSDSAKPMDPYPSRS